MQIEKHWNLANTTTGATLLEKQTVVSGGDIMDGGSIENKSKLHYNTAAAVTTDGFTLNVTGGYAAPNDWYGWEFETTYTGSDGDAIFDFNLDKIYKNHIKKKMIMTFVSFAYIANFGTVGVKKGKVVDFRRNMKFDFVKSKYKKDLTAYVYSGISILNKIALSKDFRNSENFEKKLYPQIIKKFKCNVEAPLGFFHPIDNIKDIKVGNNKNSEESKYSQINKIIKMINKLKKI